MNWRRMKKLKLVISDVDIKTESYESVLTEARKEDAGIKQILISIDTQRAYCYDDVAPVLPTGIVA